MVGPSEDSPIVQVGSLLMCCSTSLFSTAFLGSLPQEGALVDFLVLSREYGIESL